jgi:hypothetical protein
MPATAAGPDAGMDAGPDAGRILSEEERAGYALRFMPAMSHYDHDAALTAHRRSPGAGHDTRPLILARGVDRSGRNDFARGRPPA